MSQELGSSEDPQASQRESLHEVQLVESDTKEKMKKVRLES